MGRVSSKRILWYQRETKTFRVRVTADSLVNNDTEDSGYNPDGAFNLTGHELRAIVSRNRDDDEDDALIVKTSANPGEVDFETQTSLPWSSASTLGEALIKFVPDDTDPDLKDELFAGLMWIAVWLIQVDGTQTVVVPPTPIDLVDTPGPALS